MALKQLGRSEEAVNVNEQVRKYAKEQLSIRSESDFFSKFNIDNGEKSRNAYYYYLLGLTDLCDGSNALATENFRKSADLDNTHPVSQFMVQLKNQNAAFPQTKK
jgi:hypothetical protein